MTVVFGPFNILMSGFDSILVEFVFIFDLDVLKSILLLQEDDLMIVMIIDIQDRLFHVEVKNKLTNGSLSDC